MRCAGCAAAKAQTFLKGDLATNLPVRLKSAALSAGQHGNSMRRGKALAAMGSNCVKSRRSNDLLYSRRAIPKLLRRAARQKRITGENLLSCWSGGLDKRRLSGRLLDLSPPGASARQSRSRAGERSKGDIPSYQVKPADVISVKDESRKNVHVEGAWQTAAGRGRPAWISAAAVRK